MNVLAASQRDRALQAGLGYRERGYARAAWQDMSKCGTVVRFVNA